MEADFGSKIINNIRWKDLVSKVTPLGSLIKIRVYHQMASWMTTTVRSPRPKVKVQSRQNHHHHHHKSISHHHQRRTQPTKRRKEEEWESNYQVHQSHHQATVQKKKTTTLTPIQRRNKCTCLPNLCRSRGVLRHRASRVVHQCRRRVGWVRRVILVGGLRIDENHKIRWKWIMTLLKSSQVYHKIWLHRNLRSLLPNFHNKSHSLKTMKKVDHKLTIHFHLQQLLYQWNLNKTLK